MASTLQYRQFLAREAGRFHSGTFDGAGGDIDSAIDSDFPIKSALAQDDLYRGYWVLIPAAAAADKVRIVSAYSASSGQLDVDLAYSSVAVWQSDPYELHGAIEPGTELPLCLNEALKLCFVVVEFTITPTADQIRHSLSAQSWLKDPRWVRQVGVLTTSDDRNKVDPYDEPVRGQVKQDGATFYLEHRGRTFSTSERIYVRAIKRAYEHCKPSAGAYGDQSGLSLDTDEGPVAEDWVAPAALMIATRRDRGLSGDVEARGGLLARQQEFATVFSQRTAEYFTLPELTFTPPKLRWGPLRGSGYQVSRK